MGHKSERRTAWCGLSVYIGIFLLSGVALVQAQLPSANLPAPLRSVGLEQRLNTQLPLGLTFRDETGQPVQLRRYFTDQPVVLTLGYYQCPMLCPLVLNGLVRSLRVLTLTAGKEFAVLSVSIDPDERPALAAATKQAYLQRYQRPEAERGWHFLTGDAAAIQTLTQAVGFHYAYDADQNQYQHASGIMVLTPQGKLARYFYGVEYAPRDLRFALIEAAARRIGSAVDQVLLWCYHYDPATGQYSLLIMNLIRLAGLLTVGGLGIFMARMFWYDRYQRRT